MWVCGSRRGGLDDTPLGRRGSTPLPDPSARQKGWPLGFRVGRLVCGDPLSAALGRLTRNSRLRLFPLYTATVVRCVVPTAATAMRLFPQGRASTGEVSAPTSVLPGFVSAVTLRVAEALADLTLQRAFGFTYDSTETRKPQSSLSDRTFDTSGPRATDIMKWGWEDGPWRSPGRDGRNVA